MIYLLSILIWAAVLCVGLWSYLICVDENDRVETALKWVLYFMGGMGVVMLFYTAIDVSHCAITKCI